MNGDTSGTVPVRVESTGNVAFPDMWNRSTAMTVAATLDTAWKLSVLGLVFHPPWAPPPMEQPAAAQTQDAVTIAEPHLRDVFERLIALSGLPRDWDGQGSEPVDALAVTKAITTLRFLIDHARSAGFILPRPAVSPSPGGSIGFEWEHESDVLTIECLPASDLLAVYRCADQEETEQDFDALPALWEAVRDFLRSIA